MGLRGDAIVQFDWSVGQIMATLERLGIADNTIILLTSDNGPVVDDSYQDRAEELLNGHKPSGPWRGNKYSTFEGGTAVPQIVCWPVKVKDGQTSEALTSQIDYMRSFASLIGARMPKSAAPDSEDCLASAQWVEENVAEKHPQVVFDMQNVLRRERKANHINP